MNEKSDGAQPSRVPSVVVTTSAERQLAYGQWLLAASSSPSQGRTEWLTAGAAWLRPGALFTAVTVPAGLVHAAVGETEPEACAGHLARVLDGPLIYQPQQSGPEDEYTALLPASAGRAWRMEGTRVADRRALVLVPAPGQCQRAGAGPWWVLPPDGPGNLCSMVLWASLVTAGRSRSRRSGASGEDE